MKRKSIFLPTLTLALIAVAAAFNDTNALSYTVSGGQVNTNSGDGLIVNTSLALPGSPNNTFWLNDGQSKTFSFFNIWTPESDVAEGEDTEGKNISATLFFADPLTNATVEGLTFGGSILWGFSQWGEVVWNGPVTITAGGRIFSVELSEEKFNEGHLGLGDYGATVMATVKQIGTYVAVSDTGASAMLLGLSMMAFTVLFSRKRIQA